MIFYGPQGWRVGRPPYLGTVRGDVFHPFNCRKMRAQRRNVASYPRIESLLGECQVELESGFIGNRQFLAGGSNPLGHTISHIPFLEDALGVH